MRAPAFWDRPVGFLAATLWPAGFIYGSIAASRMARPGLRARVPVVCVGNVTVGGSGKTPTAIMVAGLLSEMGHRPAFLSRGYRGRLAGPVAVDPARHDADDVGDEPLLLVRHAPTIVARDRPAGAALAVDLGATVIVMDDGLQNPSLEKDLGLAVFDGTSGIGNGRVLPAGPLRAPLAAQWPRIHASIIVGPGRAGDDIADAATLRSSPVFRSEIRPRAATLGALSNRSVLAFAGIGRPAKFFATCRAMGLDVVEARSFPDHHAYRAAEITALLDEAERANLLPVTTEKDEVRLAALRLSEPRLAGLRAIAVEAAMADPDAFRRLLVERIGPPRPAS